MSSHNPNLPPVMEVPTDPIDPIPSLAINPRAQPRMGRYLVMLAVLFALGLVAGLVPRHRQRQRLLEETVQLATPTVSVVHPVPGKSSAGVPLTAEVKPYVEATIHARASGYIRRWLVDMGAKVESGQLLAEIDTPELNQDLARSRAQLAQAEAALSLAKITGDRWADLLKTDSVSAQEAAEKRADLDLKTAAVEAARADVHRLEDLESFDRVTAPFAGVITARLIDVGDLVAAGGQELFRLAQTSTLRVFVRVPQTMARGATIGQTADLTVAELPRRVFSAKIVRTAGIVSADSRTLLTELEVDNSKGEILAGSYAQVRFTGTNSTVPLVVPANTLLFRAEGSQVGVVLAGGKVELRNIVMGRDFGTTIEVLDGVNANDSVIINPSDALVSGQIVRLAENHPTVAAK